MNQSVSPDHLYKRSELPGRLGVSLRTIDHLLHSGRLPAYRIQGARSTGQKSFYRVSEAQVLEYLASTVVSPDAPITPRRRRRAS